jgi:indole-3-glycerol phosphate synthase
VSASPTILDKIVKSTREEVNRRKKSMPVSEVWAGFVETRWERHNFAEALKGPDISVIAEFKRCTPSTGVLRADAPVNEIVQQYEKGGAAAASILTEEEHFWGNLRDLFVARESCHLPLLRKDFIVDTYQLYESAAAGADAVLLIVAALSQKDLYAFMETARTLCLSALVETNNAEEIKRAVDVGAEIIGINNRDLHDFSVSLDRTISLRPHVPAGVAVVSESGIHNRNDLKILTDADVNAALIGEMLMCASSPETALARLITR